MNTKVTSLRCFNCGNLVHVRTNCPRKNHTCYCCEVLGHRQHECPCIKRDESKEPIQRPMMGLNQNEEVTKACTQAFQITIKEACNDSDDVTSIFFMNFRPTRILFDYGATNFFYRIIMLCFLEYMSFIRLKSFILLVRLMM